VELLAFAKAALQSTNRLRLDDIEMLLTSTRTLVAQIENRDVTLKIESDVFSAGIRVLKAGRMAYLPLTEPSIPLLEAGIKAALPVADPAPFPRFTVMDRVRAGLQAHDPEVEALAEQPERVRDVARDLAARAFAVAGVETLEAGIRVGVEERLVMTCCSPKYAHARRTGFAAYADINSKDFDYLNSRRLPDLAAVAGLGAALAQSMPAAEAAPESEGIKGRALPVLLHPYFVSSLLRTLVAEHLYASTAQAGMSRLKPGDRAASPLVTLWDDATAPFDGSTFPVDDEGSPSRRNAVIEKGVLKMFLYDRATAAKDGVQSTGNGRRRPVLIEEPHEAPVRCTVNDLYIEPGATPLSSMVTGIPAGLVVKSLLGFHVANKTTGDIANTVFGGRVIRDGRVVAMPEPGRWAVKGNALECLRNVTAVSTETMPVGNGVLPWLQTDFVVA
jgi:predicted Zn-dependent protease